MAIANYAGRCLALASALATAVAFTAIPNSAEAQISTGEAVGIGLGSFALGSMMGSAANPYYGSSYPAYGYYAPPPPVVTYSAPPVTRYYDTYSYSYPTTSSTYDYYGSYRPAYGYGYGW